MSLINKKRIEKHLNILTSLREQMSRKNKRKGSKEAMFNIRNSGVVMSFLLVFVQFIISFEYFVFMVLSVRIKIPYIEKCPLSTRPKISCTDISSCFHQLRFHLLAILLQLEVLISALFKQFVTSCNISPMLSRNSLCLKVTNLPFV